MKKLAPLDFQPKQRIADVQLSLVSVFKASLCPCLCYPTHYILLRPTVCYFNASFIVISELFYWLFKRLTPSVFIEEKTVHTVGGKQLEMRLYYFVFNGLF